MQKRIVIGNWKMNPVSSKEATKLFKEIKDGLSKIKKIDTVACAPFVFLDGLKKDSMGKLKLGSQNVYPGDVGAETGEVSTAMLINLKVKYTIVGHSERRAMGEKNEDINKKIKSLLSNGIVPVLCLGEKERDPEHTYLGFVKTQIEECLEGVSKSALNSVVIAYEPIWAIGNNAPRPATPAEFFEMSIFIRKVLNDKFGGKNVEGIRIIYGGSVTPEDTLPFLLDGKADGFLVGRASLDSKKLIKIIELTENAER